jgi:hypothetical protein
VTRYLLAAVITAISAPALASDVAVSLSINQPGFYGQINIGDYPRPPVIYARPVVIERAPEYVAAEPLYLHVPPGHEKHWRKHCAEYDACSRPVYFVPHKWYQNEYERLRGHGDEARGERRKEGHGRGHDEGRGREERDH